MRISNWESAKRQAITKLPAFTITAAVIFVIASFIAFWNGQIDYQEQADQLNWTVTDATVSFVHEYYDAFHSISPLMMCMWVLFPMTLHPRMCRLWLIL